MSDIKLVPKSWGFEKWVVNKEYCGKLLYVVCDHRCSIHFHKEKDETFYVQSGFIRLTYLSREEVAYKKSLGYTDEDITHNMKVITMSKGDSFHVPVGMWHQFYAIEDSEIFEFSTHHEDDDSFRITKGN